jgi:hypothetical protein
MTGATLSLQINQIMKKTEKFVYHNRDGCRELDKSQHTDGYAFAG